MDVLVDTNFILTAVKQKIDFESLADELFDKKIAFLDRLISLEKNG